MISLFYDDVSVAGGFVLLKVIYRIILKGEQGEIWKEAIAVNFQVISRRLITEAEVNHETPQSYWPACLELKRSTSRM
jgi:hypothetical protein